MNLEIMSLKELKRLQSDLAVVILNREKIKKAEALTAIEEVAHAAGFSLKELCGSTAAVIQKMSIMMKRKVPTATLTCSCFLSLDKSFLWWLLSRASSREHQ